MGSKDFFLEPDESKTLGDVNFMRKSVRVRRTFPKTKGNQGEFEVIKEISATDARNFNNFNGNGNYQSNGTVNRNGNSASVEHQPFNLEQNSLEPRQVDTTLDMFRNMARQMKR